MLEAVRVLVSPLNWVRRTVFLIRDRKRDLDAAKGLIADELFYNGSILARVEFGSSVESVRAALRFDSYDAHARTAYALNQKAPALWEDVTTTVGALKRTAATGVLPSFKSDHVLELADDLRRLSY